MRLLLWLIAFSLIGLFKSHGQILRVDKSYLASDSVNYFIGATDLRFSLNNLNSTPGDENTIVALNANLDMVYLLKKISLISINQYRYLKPGSGSPINNGSTHFRAIVNRKRMLTQEAYVQLQFDETRQMTSRFLIGTGARLNLNKETNTIYAGLGPFYETERWQEEGRSIVTEFIKLNSYLGGEVDLNKSINIHGIFYYQTGYDDAIEALRNRFSSILEFRNRFSKRLVFKTVFNATYDQRPIINVVRLLYSLEFGIEFRIN